MTWKGLKYFLSIYLKRPDETKDVTCWFMNNKPTSTNSSSSTITTITTTTNNNNYPFYPEYKGSMFVQNVGNCQNDYMVSQT
jgi:hypothetical protein